MFLCPAVISVTLRVSVSVGGKCSVFSVSWSGVGHKPLCYSFTASVLTAETQLQSSYCYKLCQVMKSQDETMGFHSIQKRFETHFFQFYDMFPNVMFMLREAAAKAATCSAECNLRRGQNRGANRHTYPVAILVFSCCEHHQNLP